MALCSARLLGRRPRVRLRPGSPHTTGSSARSLRHSRALSPLRTPRQGSSTATAHSSNSPCWRADYKDKATSLKQLQHRQSQPEMQTPPAHQQWKRPRKATHITPCVSSAALEALGYWDEVWQASHNRMLLIQTHTEPVSRGDRAHSTPRAGTPTSPSTRRAPCPYLVMS